MDFLNIIIGNPYHEKEVERAGVAKVVEGGSLKGYVINNSISLL